jgi:hypothetical protein
MFYRDEINQTKGWTASPSRGHAVVQDDKVDKHSIKSAHAPSLSVFAMRLPRIRERKANSKFRLRCLAGDLKKER